MHAIQSIQRWCEESDFSSWHENFNKSLIEIYKRMLCTLRNVTFSRWDLCYCKSHKPRGIRHQFKTYMNMQLDCASLKILMKEWTSWIAAFDTSHSRGKRGFGNKLMPRAHDFWWFDSELWKEQPRNNHRELLLCAVISWKGYSTEFHHVFIIVDSRGGGGGCSFYYLKIK